VKTIYHLAYQDARPNVHYFADATQRIVFWW